MLKIQAFVVKNNNEIKPLILMIIRQTLYICNGNKAGEEGSLSELYFVFKLKI